MNARGFFEPMHRPSPFTGRQMTTALDASLALLRGYAIEDDRRAGFPAASFVLLHEIGLTTAVLSPTDGGLALGWHASSTRMLIDILQRLGGAHLAVARLFEGHVNAFQLLWRHAGDAQRKRLACYVAHGGLLGVWNAPAPEGALRLVAVNGRRVLRGRKIYASGVGAIARPLVTAVDEDGKWLMLWPDAASARIDLSEWKVHGMRASATGNIVFDDLPVEDDEVFGGHDDYHRQPLFSGGAWRFLAAQLGAAAALHDLTREGLLAGGRGADPHQRARLAEAAIDIESARLWVEAAALRAERDADDDAARTVAYVGMARIAVERVSMDVIALSQRSIGLRAMMDASPMERIARDLATYLRQPVPDAIRDGVAAAVLDNGAPALQRWTV
jgi:alkylation response protein AidB-like acyl-CoA dehydrogenase